MLLLVTIANFSNIPTNFYSFIYSVTEFDYFMETIVNLVLLQCTLHRYSNLMSVF